jgi:cell division septation protein DedD
VSKQEEPVALRELGTQTAPRVVLPAPVAPAPPGVSQPSETKKVRTVTIRPDGTAAAPPAAAAPRPAPAPHAGTAPTRSIGGGPISLDPQSSDPAPAPKARAAAAPPPSRTEVTASTGGFVVQLSSQKSEAEALASFRSLQAKFPNELGDRQPVIRRADLGKKGVFYRTAVGPFASAHEASQFCASYKAAGGQCVVPNE